MGTDDLLKLPFLGYIFLARDRFPYLILEKIIVVQQKNIFFCFSWAHVKTLEVPPPNKMALICYCLVIVHDNVLMSKVTAEEHLY